MPERKRPTTKRRPAVLSRRKQSAFRVVSLLLPFVVLALTELVLRLFGFGGYPPTIHKVGHVEGGTLAITDQAAAASWFFANALRPGTLEPYLFLDPKPTNTIRIFFVGESAIRGWPQPRNLASSAFLQQMLHDAWPERRVEIINLGTTAVASFPVLEMMTAVLDYEPDLIVISTGNNEFFGTYGMASIGRAGSRPWMLKANRRLRSLALVQASEQVFRSKKDDLDHSLMEVMIGRSYIAPDDWRREAAANNLYHNIAEMADRCRERGVPVLVCTQPCNERDLPPMGADKLDDLAPVTQQEIKSLLAKAEMHRHDQPEIAIGALRRILELCPNHARAHFLLGQALAAQGKHAEALNQFIQARDLDSMPWRTPSLSQEAILRAAHEHNAPICDLVKAFREASPGGAIGWDLMDDHVHPTVRGQALIAETIVACLTNLQGGLRVSAEALTRIAKWNVYAQRLGDNIYDRYATIYDMRQMFEAALLRGNNPEVYERFNSAAISIEKGLSPEVRQAVHEWETVRVSAKGRVPITGLVARVLMRQGKLKEALEMFSVALKSFPEYTSWHLEYAYYVLQCKEMLYGGLGEQERLWALQEIRQGKFMLEQRVAESGMTERFTGRLHQLRGEFAEAIPLFLRCRSKFMGLDRVAVDQALVVSYLRTRQYDKARALAAEGAANAGQHAGYYRTILDNFPALQKAAEEPYPTNSPLVLSNAPAR